MTYRKHFIVLAVLAALGSAPAFAVDTPPADGPHGVAKLDKNGDGMIDRSEAAAAPRLAGKFDSLDKNKDGKLSSDELPKRGDFRHGAHDRMAKLDTNNDGRISREEAKADPKLAARFDKMDVNKDGYVDKADFQARAQQHRDQWFANADTDKDGKLSKAEFDAAAAKHGPMGRRMGPGGDHHGHGAQGKPPASTPAVAPVKPGTAQ